MEPGDVLYMPKGVVHYATTLNETESYHLTIGLHRENMQWLDVLHWLLEDEVSDAAASLRPTSAGGDGPS